MKARGLVRAADAEIDPDGFANLCTKCVCALKRVSSTIEDVIFWLFSEELIIALVDFSLGAKRLFRVELTLHHVKFSVDLGQPTLRFNQNHPIHSVCYVLRGHRYSAVIDIETRVERLETEAFCLAGFCNGRDHPATRSRDGVEIDIVIHPAVGMVPQRDVDCVADQTHQHRNLTAFVKAPVTRTLAGTKTSPFFDGLKGHLDPGRTAGDDWRRQIIGMADDIACFCLISPRNGWGI